MTDDFKDRLLTEMEEELVGQGFIISEINNTKPWGGYFVIDENQTQQFAHRYFDASVTHALESQVKISGKILFIAPNKRMSWQFHDRRDEFWQVLIGAVGVVTSATDDEHAVEILEQGDKIQIKAGMRHRLLGMENWGVVAEIWRHTDPDNPSTEEDIVRIHDDFGR